MNRPSARIALKFSDHDRTRHDPHLPECPWPTEPCSHTPMQGREPLFCTDCLTECICDRLCFFEQRVLDAAREAVRHALGPMEANDPSQRDTALAAIDALRGES